MKKEILFGTKEWGTKGFIRFQDTSGKIHKFPDSVYVFYDAVIRGVLPELRKEWKEWVDISKTITTTEVILPFLDYLEEKHSNYEQRQH